MEFRTAEDADTTVEILDIDSDGDVGIRLYYPAGVGYDGEKGEYITAYLNNEERLRVIDYLLRYTKE